VLELATSLKQKLLHKLLQLLPIVLLESSLHLSHFFHLF